MGRANEKLDRIIPACKRKAGQFNTQEISNALQQSAWIEIQLMNHLFQSRMSHPTGCLQEVPSRLPSWGCKEKNYSNIELGKK